jgi:hypothetical protein
MAEDNRKHVRIAFHLPVEIKGHKGPHKISELSMGGLFVDSNSPRQFKRGDEINMVARVSDEEEPIHAICRVTHVTREGIGIEFVHITLQDAWELIMETDWESAAEEPSP